jgi:hypothetical protein
MTIEERWEQGVPHDTRSTKIYRSIADIDFKECNDYFQWKAGGDGDNGEQLMYLLDIHFEQMDKQKKKSGTK